MEIVQISRCDTLMMDQLINANIVIGLDKNVHYSGAPYHFVSCNTFNQSH